MRSKSKREKGKKNKHEHCSFKEKQEKRTWSVLYDFKIFVYLFFTYTSEHYTIAL